MLIKFLDISWVGGHPPENKCSVWRRFSCSGKELWLQDVVRFKDQERDWFRMRYQAIPAAIQYDNQNFFQIAAIQSASTGLPGILLGTQFASTYGIGRAILSIVLGNLILWLIGIAVVSTVERVHINAIHNIKAYIGKFGALVFTIVLMYSLLNWYATEIAIAGNQSINVLQRTIGWNGDGIIRIGAFLGLLISLLGIGGIRLFRQISVISLPLIFIYYVYAIGSSEPFGIIEYQWGVSFQAVLFTILNGIAGVITYPTFFRHSRSKAHSYMALTLIACIVSFIEISSAWMCYIGLPNCYPVMGLIPFILFVVITLTNCNLLNIYLATSCIEAFIPRFLGPKGYAIVGLTGTLIYTFLQISTPVKFLEDLTNAYIGVLGVVLIVGFILRIVVKHRPRPYDKAINLVIWFLGCLFATIYEVLHPLEGVDALLAGVKTSFLFYLVVLFLEETLWAIRKKWALLHE